MKNVNIPAEIVILNSFKFQKHNLNEASQRIKKWIEIDNFPCNISLLVGERRIPDINEKIETVSNDNGM